MKDADANNKAGKSTSVGGDYFYRNPYVGRVLDGYACAEACTVENTDKNYTILKIETPDTFADYNKSRRKMFPLPVRIRMIGPSGTSYKDEDLKKAEKILLNDSN